MVRILKPIAGLVISGVTAVAAALFAADKAGSPPVDEISGRLELRVNDCFNHDHEGPRTTHVVWDTNTSKATELDVSGLDASSLKLGEIVRVQGRFNDNAAKAGARPTFEATAVSYTEGHGKTVAGEDPPVAHGAPSVTELSCLLIFANSDNYTVSNTTITAVSNLLFGSTDNVSDSIFEASYGHYNLVYSNMITVTLNYNATNVSGGVIEDDMADEALIALGAGWENDYDRILFFSPEGGGPGTAYAYRPGKRSVYSYGWTTTTMDGYVHELGHNFGFPHSAVGGNEYADRTCVMGYSHLGRGNVSATYGAVKKVRNNWFAFDPGGHTNLSNDVTFNIYPVSIDPGVTPGMRVVQIATNTYVSYRRYLPPYAWLRYTSDGDKIHIHTNASPDEYSYRVGSLVDGGTFSAADSTQIKFEAYGPGNAYAIVSFDYPDTNSRPDAPDQNETVYMNTVTPITLQATDADLDGLIFTIHSGPANGLLTGSSSNRVYEPNTNYTGPDSFVYKVDDGTVTTYATVTINVVLPEVSVIATDSSASETGPDNGVYTVTRTGNTNVAMNVVFSMSGTATDPADYTINAASPLVIPVGQTSAIVTLTPDDDSVFDEGDETAVFTITANAAYSISTASDTVTIADNDFVAPAVSNYSSTSLSESSASLSGWVSSGGIVQAWICWGTSDGGVSSTSDWDNVVAIGPAAVDAEFSTTVNGLETNATYWYRCYVTNNLGVAWSDAADTFNGTPAGGGTTGTPGLWYGTTSGNIDVTSTNPRSQILVDVSSETENSIAGNTTEIYTGFIFDADGQISFTEDIDDKARIWINAIEVIANDSWSTRTSTTNLNLSPGWNAIEIRISNGNGGSGPDSSPGIGFDPTGSNNWQVLTDPGDGSLLSIDGVTPPTIANVAPSTIADDRATLNGNLSASDTNYNVYIYWGTSDGSTNGGSWDFSAYVGSWTNTSISLSYSVSNLSAGLEYFYTFQATNVMTNAMAAP